MELPISLQKTEAEKLIELANYCGVSPQSLAETFIKDSIQSFLNQQNELRDSLIVTT